ncbi:hypothetical protein HN51_069181 [Arachis hypogaea]
MMNALPSECSSGCESGWTLYLEEPSFLNASTSTPFLPQEHHKMKPKTSVPQEEDDLSMLSDASSGPPPPAAHQRTIKRQKLAVKEKRHHLPSFLDDDDEDTASSPLCDFSINNVTTFTNQQTSQDSVLELDYSHGFSATYFEVRENKNDIFLANSLYQEMKSG